MATLHSITELRAMQLADILTEIAEQSRVLAKMRIDVAGKSEKDTAKLRRLRKAIAQLHTVVAEKQGTTPQLKTQPKSSRVPALRRSKSAAKATPKPA